MSVDGSWRLGPGARRRIVVAVNGGESQKRAAARFCVSPATVNRWVRREREAGDSERASGAWARDRSSRPRRSPAMLSDAEHDRICEVRKHTGWGPRLIAGVVGLPHSTVHAALRRRGCSRRPKAPREAVVRYQWPCPGQLLHVDVKKFGRFQTPGHAVTGDRRQRSRRVGWDYVHSLVDDCSRLAYSEVLDDERADTVTAFIRRAPGLAARARHRHRAAPQRQRVGLHPQPWAARAAAPPSDRAQDHTALPAADQRQGRALPADPRPRMGLRPQLRRLTRASRRADTLAQALQHAQTPLSHRRPPAPHPRSPGHRAEQLIAA